MKENIIQLTTLGSIILPYSIKKYVPSILDFTALFLNNNILMFKLKSLMQGCTYLYNILHMYSRNIQQRDKNPMMRRRALSN